MTPHINFMLEQYKVILWDFDGVLMNSNAVRDIGFEQVLSEYPKHQVDKLMEFHKRNGGLSRYVKFRYFFEKILQESISEEKVIELANSFSIIMKDLLMNPDLLIQDSLDFVKRNYKAISMHIVSGSDQTELRFLCRELEIEKYFLSIHGSPTPKIELVRSIIKEYHYNNADTILIGDSVNDNEAAIENKIMFCGYNNELLRDVGFYKEKLSY
jgi:phosphoglycolate phosphatase-like HAD superfamily hydrolase